MTAKPVSLSGRTAVLATMHGKEQAIAPVLAAALDIHVIVPSGFDTDQFGTFTRDIPRTGSQIDAARQKALAAMALTGGDLALASEGSFGPDPSIPWVPCDLELVILIDRHHDLELVGQAHSTATNYRQATVTSLQAALEFAAAAQFPSHALVARVDPAAKDPETLHKGIAREEHLVAIVNQLLASHGSLWLETDMRAHLNPSRMAVIAQATHHLTKKIQQTCPQCHWPGFDVTRRLPGLPCAQCRLPTALIQTWEYECSRCHHQHRVEFPTGARAADPGQCGFCNP